MLSVDGSAAHGRFGIFDVMPAEVIPIHGVAASGRSALGATDVQPNRSRASVVVLIWLHVQYPIHNN